MSKKPKPGEWWLWENAGRESIMFCVGHDPDGELVWQENQGSPSSGYCGAPVRHLPDCTGFDYEVPEEKWRLLDCDELIQEGDQVYLGGTWNTVDTSQIGLEQMVNVSYCRRVKPKPLTINTGRWLTKCGVVLTLDINGWLDDKVSEIVRQKLDDRQTWGDN